MKEEFSELCPIFVDSSKGIVQQGTGVLIDLFDSIFLFTAAHVLDEMVERSHDLLIPCKGGIDSIEGSYSYIALKHKQNRNEDMIDVAYFKLTNEIAERLHDSLEPLPEDKIVPINNFSLFDVATFAGYPHSKSKIRGTAAMNEIASYSGVLVDQNEYKELGYEPALNILTKFRAKKAVKPDGTHYNSPKPQGISGGGIYLWPKTDDGKSHPVDRRLIGIGHTYKKRENLLIGTNILYCINCVLRNNPQYKDAHA